MRNCLQKREGMISPSTGLYINALAFLIFLGSIAMHGIAAGESANSSLSCHRLLSRRFIKHFIDGKNFEQRLNDLNSMVVSSVSKKEMDVKIRKLLKEAAVKLKEGHVFFRIDPENPRILIILPRQDGAGLNHFAYGLNRKLKILAKDEDGLLIEYNPANLFRLSAGALFDSEAFRYSISNEEIAALKISEFTIHEIRHAYNFIKALRDEVDHVFLGVVRNPDTGTPFSETYPHDFSIDEIPAFVLQIGLQLRNLRRAEAKKDYEFVDANKDFNLQLIQTLQSLNSATKTFAHLFLEALSSMKRNNSEWTFKKNRVAGSKTELLSVEWGHSHDHSRIEMSVAPMIEARPEIEKFLTGISFSSEEGSLEVQVLGNELSTGAKVGYERSLEKARIKAQALLEVTQFLNTRLLALEELSKSEKWTEGVAIASEMRSQIGLISLFPREK